MKKTKILIVLVILLGLSSFLLFPMSKAKFTESTTYTVSVRTKMTPVEANAFTYTAKTQSYAITKEGYYVFQIWGANGGSSSNGYAGGTGDILTNMGYFSAGQNLSIVVGGRGSNGSGTTGGVGGYNGGGAGGGGGWFASNSGGAGGGATSVSLNGTALGDRILVASGGGGGGAGGSSSTTIGGSAGTTTFYAVKQLTYDGFVKVGQSGVGINNISGSNYSGGGGSITGGATHYTAGDAGLSQGTNGVEGTGGIGGNWSGGGGGGFYGGAGGSSTNSISGGGGSGSSYYSMALSTAIPPDVRSKLYANTSFPQVPYTNGYGYLIITYIGTTLP